MTAEDGMESKLLDSRIFGGCVDCLKKAWLDVVDAVEPASVRAFICPIHALVQALASPEVGPDFTSCFCQAVDDYDVCSLLVFCDE